MTFDFDSAALRIYEAYGHGWPRTLICAELRAAYNAGKADAAQEWREYAEKLRETLKKYASPEDWLECEVYPPYADAALALPIPGETTTERETRD